MTDEKKLKKAKDLFDSLCQMLDEKDGHYEKHEDDLVVTFVMGGDDIPMPFILKIDADRELVRLVSPIPVVFEGDRRLDGAIATCQANYRLADGSFDYDYTEGKASFRLTSSYVDSLISKDLLEFLVALAGNVVDKYNDKLFMLATGDMSLEEFIAQI